MLGVSCGAIDVLTASSSQPFWGCLAVIRTLMRQAVVVRDRRLVEAEMVAMSDEAAIDFTEALQAWMEGAGAAPPLLHTFTSSPEDLEAFGEALSEEWNRLLDAVDARSSNTPAEAPLAVSGPQVVAVLDFYDLRCWGSILWKRLAERALAGSLGPAVELRFVVRAMTESDRLPDEQALLLSSFDEIWVPSSFHLPVFARPEVAPTFVVPESFDESFFSAALAPARSELSAGITFLAVSFYRPVAEVPSWNEVRKAMPLTMEAFFREFGGQPGARLIVKGASGDAETRSEILAWMESRGIDPSFIEQLELVGFCDASALRDLYAKADVFVGVSRGEGWGRPIVEAMGMGLPCIVTRFSGPVEFVRDDCAYLVDAPLAQVSTFLPTFVGWGNFANPSVDAIREAMRTAASDGLLLRAKGARAAEHVHAHYHRAAIAERMVARARVFFARS